MTDRERDELLAAATDRFERRLADESGKQRAETAQLRVETMKGQAEIRADVAGLRLEMTERLGAMRTDMVEMRMDTAGQFGAVRVDLATRHRELLKWALTFSLGLVTAIAGIASGIGYYFARQ